MLSYIFSALALLVSVFSFFYFRAFVKKRTAVERIPSDTRAAVRLIINEIDSITDRDSALVEERVKKLKALLEEVDRRIVVYNGELENRARRDVLYSELGKAAKRTPAILRGADAAGGDKLVVRNELAGRDKPALVQRDAARTGQGEIFSEGGGAAVSESVSEVDKREEALGMAAAGMAPQEIAARLGMSITEVELALFLGGR